MPWLLWRVPTSARSSSKRKRSRVEELRASLFDPPTLDMLEEFGITGTLIGQGVITPTSVGG